MQCNGERPHGVPRTLRLPSWCWDDDDEYGSEAVCWERVQQQCLSHRFADVGVILGKNFGSMFGRCLPILGYFLDSCLLLMFGEMGDNSGVHVGLIDV